MGTAAKVGLGAVVLGSAVGGLVMLGRVQESGRLPYYERDYVTYGLPRREVLENTAAWAGAAALVAGGLRLEARGGIPAAIGLTMGAVGVGFCAGQVAALVP